MPLTDVFSSDAFGLVPLTDAINKVKFVPSRIDEMGLFQATSVAQTSVAIEERSGILSLVSPSARGGPGQTLDKAKRVLRQVAIPHFEVNDAVLAEEIQNVRAWGSETESEMLMNKLAERFQIHTQSHSSTIEYSRLGAIKSLVTYADATTLDLNTLFGTTAPSTVNWDLDNFSANSGALRNNCSGVIRTIASALEGVPFTGVHAFCGDTFWDELIGNPEVRETYLQWSDAANMREAGVNAGSSFGRFAFGGIMFENYRGSVDGTDFITATKCHAFPVGVPGLFRTYYGPADYNETVNRPGQPFYARQKAMDNDKGWNLDTQTNVLNICTRPNALVEGNNT